MLIIIESKTYTKINTETLVGGVTIALQIPSLVNLRVDI